MASNDIIDWDSVENSGGGRPRVPEGDYRVKIKSVKHATSQAGNSMMVWTFIGVEGKLKGKELTEYTALTTKALFKIKDLLETVSGSTPKGKADTRKTLEYCKKQVGKEFGVTLEDEEYTNDSGKTFISSKVSDYVSLKDLSDEDPEDEDVEEDEEEEDDGLDEMDRTQLKAHIKTESVDVTVKKSMSDDDIRAAIRAASSDDEEEEIEEVDLDEM